jgi:gamma-glutamyl:cysteine ligase YbdK (ATP-grasp superfamily)
LRMTAALVAVLQALARTSAESDGSGYLGSSRADYDQNRWAALRFGPRARLLHPEGGAGLAGVPELWGELMERIRPALDDFGGTELAGAVEPTACEGDRQVEFGRADGLHAVCADLVERTVG